MQELQIIKENVKKVVTLLDETKNFIDSDFKSEVALQTSLAFMLKSAIDLNYHVHESLSKYPKKG